ncbi:MFS transporter [Brunnivagina elsteri]|uniref:Arabinose transporter permease n=1 Tax=Brunnivagina elsteri CCALA 953 TaxID=987040 RepID=A0A2A2TK77_9CYAN|nr:MFS transporter [Calothrix elsteri]PAX56527.1 arabinose transporter permease [Calothrix elsteri CCALA 953]
MNNSATKLPPRQATNIFVDKNFYIVNFVTLMGILGGTLYNPALPTIQQFFKVSEAQVTLTSTIYQLPSAIITPLFGILADILGRKIVLIPSLLIFAFGGFFSSFASTFTNHLGWRLFQGIGAASLEPLQVTIIGDLYRGRTLGTAIAFNSVLIGISGALFPLIGGKIGELDWRYTFLPAVIAIPLAIWSFIALRVPKHRNHSEKFEFKAYLKSTTNSINKRPVIGLLFGTMSLFLLQTLCLTYIPLLAAEKFQTSAGLNGAILASMSISLALVASQLGRIVQHISEIKLIKLSFLLFAIALLIIPFLPNVWLLFIPMFLIGAAQGLALPSSQALLAGLADQESRGGFMAVNMTVVSWGQTFGPFLGSIVLLFSGIQSVFYISAIFSLISFAIFNYFLTTKVLNFTAKTIHMGGMAAPSSSQVIQLPDIPSPTILQQPVAQLLHIQTRRIIELPEHFEIINIGKSSTNIPLEVNLANLPDTEVVSRIHAQIRFDGEEYYIQDMGSANGTYINQYPLVPGIWYKLKSGLGFSLGRRSKVSFIFELV